MNLTTALLVIAVVVYTMARRFAGEPLTSRRLVAMPVVLTLIGVYQIAQVGLSHVTADLVALGLGGLIAFGGGALRGRTVRIFVRDGHVWYRYTWVTLAVWGALIALRFAQAATAVSFGADQAVLTAALLMTLGLSFLGEAAVVGPRAMATGAPFAPRRRERAGAGR